MNRKLFITAGIVLPFLVLFLVKSNQSEAFCEKYSCTKSSCCDSRCGACGVCCSWTEECERCNESCGDVNECGSCGSTKHTCWDGSETCGSCPPPGPTPTPAPCNSNCNGNNFCTSGYCFNGQCRNSTCPSDNTCSCSAGGKVVDCSSGAPIPNVTVAVYNDTWGQQTRYGSTDSNGNWSIPGFVRQDDGYAVRIYQSAPAGYSGSQKTTTTGWSWNNCSSSDTPYGSGSYECQRGWVNDCNGLDNTGAKNRCNFCYNIQPICTNAIPTCPIGAQLLTNPGFDAESTGWGYYSDPAPYNASGSWSRAALKNTSYGSARAGWSQTINATTLRGKYVRVSGNIYRTADMSYSPYIGFNVIHGGIRENNYGGIAVSSAVNSCEQIYRDILIPNDADQLQIFTYMWDAPAGDSYTDWMSLCEIPAPTPACVITASSDQYVTVSPIVSGTNLTLNWSQNFSSAAWNTIDNVAVVLGTNQICVREADPTKVGYNLSTNCQSTINTAQVLPKTTTQLTRIGLIPNTQYFYRVIYIDNNN